jgi:hypothetical protein
MSRMVRRLRLRCRGEEGMSLIFALGVLTLLGTFVASVLTLTGVSFKNTVVTRGSHDKLYAADGGADTAIQMVRSSASYCPEVSSTPTNLPDQTIDGRTVHITCQTTAGSSSGAGTGPLGGYTMIFTGYPSPAGTNPNFNELFTVDGVDKGRTDNVTISGGNIFNAGGFHFRNGAPQLTLDKDVRQYNGASPYCTTDKTEAATTNQPDVNGTWTCDTTSTLPIPDPNPTIKVPTTAAPAPVVSGSCLIAFPGKYTGTGQGFDLDPNGRYYLASGVYYFENVGEVRLNGELFGGQPLAPETKAFTGNTPCSNDAAANAARPGSATGYGVTFILGGNSKLIFENDDSAEIELFTRVPADPSLESTPGYSIIAPRTAGSGYLAWTADRVLDVKGTKASFVFHGAMYAPNSPIVEMFSFPNTAAAGIAPFQGGVVVQSMMLRFKKDSGSITFAQTPAGNPSPRTTVITATADPLVSGEAPTVVKAVLVFSNSASPPQVLSWRKV